MGKNTDILLEKNIKYQAKLIYFALSKFANNQGECFPSYNTLSELTGLSVRTVINYMGELIETGWVVKQKRNLKDQNSFTSNLYFLPNLIRGYAGDAQGVMQEVHKGYAGDAQGVMQEVHTNYSILTKVNNNNGKELCKKFAISEKQLEKWVDQYQEKGGFEYILSKITLLDKQSNINNPIAWLQSALASDYKNNKNDASITALEKDRTKEFDIDAAKRSVNEDLLLPMTPTGEIILNNPLFADKMAQYTNKKTVVQEKR